jgi:hypothetical protein
MELTISIMNSSFYFLGLNPPLDFLSLLWMPSVERAVHGAVRGADGVGLQCGAIRGGTIGYGGCYQLNGHEG